VGEGLPEGGHSGGRRWWLPRLPVPGEGRLGGEGNEPASLSSRIREGGDALAWLGGGLAPDFAVAALVARTAGYRCVDGDSAREGKGSGSF
jgi:hypothetical protein